VINLRARSIIMSGMNPPALDLHSDKVRGIIATIVETVHPLRILVFGSVARGEAREHSDIDILVIMRHA
jgi:predicted nucleotidyltransferase